MIQDKRYVKKRFNLQVDTASRSYSKKFDLDKNIKVVRGIVITSNKLNMLFYRGSQKIEISGDEIFPEDYESRLLMSGINVPPDQKYAELGEVLAGNGEVKVVYKDSENTDAPFTPYEVSFYFLCELAR